MKDIVEQIRNMPDAFLGKGSTEQAITSAEEILGIQFANDYRKYLLEIGSAEADGREFTGLGKVRRTDVVEVTKINRDRGPKSLQSMYVIEEKGYDGIVIWQNSKGEVFGTRFDSEPQKIADSLSAYFEE